MEDQKAARQRVFIWSDRQTWPDRYPTRLSEPGSRACDRLADRLRDSYDAVRAYHGCRPLSTDSYLREGLKLADHAALTRHAVELFTSVCPWVTREAVEAAAAKQSGIDDRRVYACWDDRELVEHSGHYIVRGSEFIQAIGALLYCQHVLENFGTPTIIELDVPMAHLSDSDLQGLACEMTQSGRGRKVPISGGAFILHSALPASTIIGIHTVFEVRDPCGGPPYRYRSSTAGSMSAPLDGNA